MKRLLIVSVLVLAISFAAYHVLHMAFVMGYNGEIIEGLTHDLADFYGEHDRLPTNWTEFVSWSKDLKSPNHWDAADLQSHFALKWGATINPDASPSEQLFTVLDRRDFAGIEPTVNNRLYFRCLNSVPVHQNQETHP